MFGRKKVEQLQAAYALNLCTVSVSQIVDYNDLGIMEQEYDNILNNLNLQNIPKDEALLKILKQLLDVISYFRIQDGEKKLLEEQYKKRVKNAIWSAIPSPSVILAGGKAVGLVASAILAVGTGYMNYRKERASIDDEKKQKDWELQKSAMEQLHALRRELFDTAWRLADKYGFSDNYRLTERQISQYNRILTEKEADKRYERLYYIRNLFEAYPPFWYNLGHAAAEVFHNKNKYSEELRMEFKEHALSAFTEFLNNTDEDKKKSLLREDQLRAACALEKFALIASDENIALTEKTKLLQAAAKNSGSAFDTIQLCAASYLELGITEKAIDLLRMLVNEDYNAVMNAQLLSMLYISALAKEGDRYKVDHEILCKRGYAAFMFPWPERNLDKIAAKAHTDRFIETQNKYLFEQYKLIGNDYFAQCATSFDGILQSPGDITDAMTDFLSGMKKDVQTLFGEESVAQKVCDLIATKVLEYQHLFYELRARRENPEFKFEEISKEAVKEIAQRIRKQASEVHRLDKDADKFKAIARYMNNLFLFKAQTKLLGGLAVTQTEKEEKTGFAKLIEQGKKNQADREFFNVIMKYEESGNLFVDNGKKRQANLITKNFLESKHVHCKDYIKDVGVDKVLAYLDIHMGTDIMFTTEGLIVYQPGLLYGLFWSDTGIVPYNSGEIALIDGRLKIGKLTFQHEQVDMNNLNKMIDELSNLAHRNTSNVSAFMTEVGGYPLK